MFIAYFLGVFAILVLLAATIFAVTKMISERRIVPLKPFYLINALIAVVGFVLPTFY